MKETNAGNMGCREARSRFAALVDFNEATPHHREVEAVQMHVARCGACAQEFRLFELRSAVLHFSGATEPVLPDDDFFVGLKARLARGPEEVSGFAPRFDDSWLAAVSLTARQLVPALALLLALIIGATLFTPDDRASTAAHAIRAQDRVVFGDIYDYPEPTPNDVLETIVAAEEKDNVK
jgi:hypothetical protein